MAQPTPPEWIDRALGDLDALLADHAHCELKAASTALALIGRYPQHPFLVTAMIGLAHEELHHFRQVLERLERRGVPLGRPPEDRYVRRLRQLACEEPGGLGALPDQLLVCAFVEARSCERFRLLAAALDADAEHGLGRFYARLAAAEGRHWELFRDLAVRLCGERPVAARIERLARLESELVRALPPAPRMH
ncbi:MAG: tRNA-(ms[2]io[6]A)-hydroxylase [Acidobacteria bacterium]|nr:MAG: tRNA-(ms[2]io[6]A)-hydroxylase [Acidobacteriota bacterium]